MCNSIRSKIQLMKQKTVHSFKTGPGQSHSQRTELNSLDPSKVESCTLDDKTIRKN